MSGSRAGIPNNPIVISDERIPFPRTETPLRCQDDPKLFVIEEITDHNAREKALTQAKLACSRCPIATGCLKWALANKQLTPTGVWAATTARQRALLRKTLKRRLGADWVGAVAEQDRRRQEGQRAARLHPPTLRDQKIARLELELLPTRPAPYGPWKQPMTRDRQARNVALLKAALSTQPAA
ncbi:WhiB family transcriptional regulator [Streptomyces sp. URMC 123]|uniref:WhiB family transcriptional regulator n=1 Tax=Streptomyces sp. URMC 123 TaxID=3423403 RepID=UPI003F1E1364